MQRILLLLLCCGGLTSLGAQTMVRSVVGSAGTVLSDVNFGTLHFTVGEISTDRSSNGLVLNKGFHQGLAALLSTAVWTAPEVQLAVRAYPNPTVDRLQLSGDWEREDRILVSDLLGRRILERELRPERDEFDFRTLASGTYFLTLSRDGRPLRTLRVVRQ